MEQKERKNNNPKTLSVLVRNATARRDDFGTKCRDIALSCLPYCVRRFLRRGFTALQNDKSGILRKATTFITTIIFLFTLLFSMQVCAQNMAPENTKQAQSLSCNTSCSQINDCKPAQKGGIFVDSASHKINSTCVRQAANSGCFNGMPVDGGTGNYNSVGNRGSSRNHYGTDIGCTGYPNTKAFPVADNGTIVWTGLSGGSGRTMVINYEKKCTNGNGGTHSGYHTVYRHLRKYLRESGSVNRDDPIGIVGGSNYSRKTGKLCDNPAQNPAPENACNNYYAIHLHLELEDGLFYSSSTQAKKNEILKPYCQNLNALCGGCPATKNCDDGTKGSSFGSSTSFDGSVGSDGTNAEAVSPTCSYTPYLDTQTCVFCDLFKTMFNTASQIALMANVGLMGPTLDLVKIGFLIWIAVYLLKQLGSFNATNSGELAKGILFQGFRVAVIAMILNSQTAIFQAMDLTLNPVMMTGLKFTETLSNGQDCNKSDEYMQNIAGYSSKEGFSKGKPTGGLSVEIGESLVCNIKKMEDATGTFMTLGKYSVCLSFNDKPWGGTNSNDGGILPGLGYFTTGIFLWLAGLSLLLTFPWCLVDCVLQLCIAAALVPCAIGAFAFKITSKYLKIIWNFFMNAMFNFVFMALIIYIINSQLPSWIGLKSPEMVVERPDIFIKFNGLAWYGMGFIRVAAICFFCYVFFDEAKSMAEKFADSPGLGGSKGIGPMVGGTVAEYAGQAGTASLHVAGKGAKAIGAGANALVGNSFRSARNHFIGYAASRLGKNGSVTAADGKAVGHEGSFRLLGRDIKFSATQSEDGSWNLTREVHKRSQSDKAFEKVLDKNGNEVKDENGNTMYRHRKRIFGVTSGYEDMIATKDEDGNLVYTTADGKSQFRMGDDDQIAAYTTRFTRSYLGLGKVREKQNIKQYGTNRTVNTATSRTRESVDTQGNVTNSEIKMQDFNLFNRDLVRKDGTINIDTFNEMQKSIGDSKRAAQALIAQVMEKRGMKLDNKYSDRTVDIDDNGRVTIKQTQKDKDGKVISTQNVQAVMIGDQMFISNEVIDQEGNSTLNESNGIFHTVQTATKGKDGKFSYNFDGGFSEYTLSKNSHLPPLDHNGRWGNNIDRDKAMAGFTQAHYDKYLAKLNIKQMHRKTDAATYRNSDEVKRLNGMLQAKGLDSLEEAKQNMTYAQEVAKQKQENGNA